MVTLTDVAARAGVSVATASKALNNRAEVAEETEPATTTSTEETA